MCRSRDLPALEAYLAVRNASEIRIELTREGQPAQLILQASTGQRRVRFGAVLDTDAASRRRYYELLRRRTARERLETAAMLTSSVRRLAIAGIRRQFPEWDERRVQAELARRMYGAEVAERLFGADRFR